MKIKYLAYLSLTAVLSCINTFVSAQPINDDRSNAVLLTQTTNWTSPFQAYSNEGSTSNDPYVSCSSNFNDVWFKFQAASSYVKIDVRTGNSEGTLGNSTVMIFGPGNSVQACGYGGWMEDVSVISNQLSVGAWYYVAVASSYYGTFTLGINDQPGFDFRSAAIELTQRNHWTSPLGAYSNAGATSLESYTYCYTSAHDVWFKFQASTSYIKVDLKSGGTEGTAESNALNLIDDNGYNIACASDFNDASVESINLTIGNWYFISIASNTPGSFTIGINDQASFDFKAGAITLTDKNNWTSPLAAYSNVGATAVESYSYCNSNANDVWFKFQATTPFIRIYLKTGGSEGTLQNGSLNLINSSGSYVNCIYGSGTTDVSLEPLLLDVGSWYYFSIASPNPGSFTLGINDQPSFDHKAGAIPLTQKDHWTSAQAAYSNVGATTQENYSNCGGVANDVWFKFQASTSYAKVDLLTGGALGTLGSGKITVLNSGGTYIGCSGSGQSVEFFQLAVGEWYYFSISSYYPGTFTIGINDQPSFDYKIGALTLTQKNDWSSALAAYTTVSATMRDFNSSCNPANNDVWFKFNATTQFAKAIVRTGATEGTLLDAAVAIVDESNNQLTCSNGSGTTDVSSQFSSLTIGNWYYVVVAGTAGSFTLSFNDQVACANSPLLYSIQTTQSCYGGATGTFTMNNSETGVDYYLNGGSKISGSNGAPVSWPTLAAGTYTLTAVRGTCATVTLATNPITSYAQLSSYTLTPLSSATFCQGSSVVLQQSGSTASITYNLMRTPAGGGTAQLAATLTGNGSALNFPAQTLAGTYYVEAKNAGNCAITYGSVPVTVNTIPLNQSFIGPQYICPGSSVTLTVEQTQATYTYRLNGPGVSVVQTGGGGPLSWSGINTAGTYSILATHPTNGCTLTFAKTITLTAATTVNDYPVTGSKTMCQGDGALISITGSQANIQYRVKSGSTYFGEAVNGLGNTNTLALATVTQAGTYSVEAVDPTSGCGRVLSTSAVIVVNSLPSAFSVGGGGQIAGGNTSFPITLSGSQSSAVGYQLYRDELPVAGTTIYGNMGPLSWAAQSVKGNYTVKATTVAAPYCANYMEGSATIYETNELIVKNLAFQYKYDSRNRMIGKKVPGADWVWMVYDNRDRLVMTQDAEQRKANKWTYTKYDVYNRPIMTGIYTHSAPQTQLEMAGNLSTTIFGETYNGAAADHGYTNTVWPTANLQLLTATYYDSYAFVTPLINGGNAGITTYNYLHTDLTGQYQYDPSGSQKNFPRVLGKVTGTKASLLGTANYVYSVTYFDDESRAVQTITQNHKSGYLRVTTNYDFTGKPTEVKRTYVVSGNTNTIKETMSYDAGGRLLTVKHSINGAADVVIAKNEYNELGQLIDKKLHSADNGTTFKQSVDYRYNIRGWLTKINESTLTGGDAGDPADLFGMQLAYNDDLQTGNAANLQYNGNISAMKWSAFLGTGVVKERAYNYKYDALNRIKSAEYKTGAAGVWTLPVGSSFTERNYQYDLNGNILSLTRKGPGTSTLDSLSYIYYDGATATRSNQLLKVADAGDKTKGFVDGANGGHDYVYDANGNMIVDRNKNIASITYNHLNLPVRVTKQNGDYVEYTYNAGGTKVAQTVSEAVANPALKTTDYLGELIYENNALKLINHAEGRALPGGTWEYQYHLKDHLGNVRTTFTAAPQTETTTATLEDNHIAQDLASYLKYKEARRVNSYLFDHTNDGTPVKGTTPGYAQRLNGTANEKNGLARSLSVMPGDVIDVEVYAKYIDPTSTNWTAALGGLLASVANGTAAAGTVIDGAGYSTSGQQAFPYTALLDRSSDNGVGPKAYLNFLVFDRNFVVIPSKSGFRRLSATPKETGQDVNHELLSKNIVISDPGYVYIWISNEETSALDVYFDDFKVTHQKSPVVQSESFYPFGLTFDSYSRENSLENKYLYNQGIGEKTFKTERVYDLGLNVDQSRDRTYDYITGRWWQVDPKADQGGQESWSTYQYSFNNPARYNDPYGDCPMCLVWGLVEVIGSFTAAEVATGAAVAAGGATAITFSDELATVGEKVWESMGSASPYSTPAVNSAQQGGGVNSLPSSSNKNQVTMPNGTQLPDPGKGKGSVSPEKRDPKRVATEKEKQKMLDERGNKCEGCDKPATTKDVKAHHKKRHADGGETKDSNLVNLCDGCHKKVHGQGQKQQKRTGNSPPEE